MSVTFSSPRINTFLCVLFCGLFGVYFSLAMTSSQASDCLSCSSSLPEYIFCDNTILTSHLQHHLFSCCFITLSAIKSSPTFICLAQGRCQPCQPRQKYLIILSVSSRLSILTSEFGVLNCTISHSPLSQR